MAPGTEFARDFCAEIGPLQLGVVLVLQFFVNWLHLQKTTIEDIVKHVFVMRIGGKKFFLSGIGILPIHWNIFCKAIQFSKPFHEELCLKIKKKITNIEVTVYSITPNCSCCINQPRKEQHEIHIQNLSFQGSCLITLFSNSGIRSLLPRSVWHCCHDAIFKTSYDWSKLM